MREPECGDIVFERRMGLFAEVRTEVLSASGHRTDAVRFSTAALHVTVGRGDYQHLLVFPPLDDLLDATDEMVQRVGPAPRI